MLLARRETTDQWNRIWNTEIDAQMHAAVDYLQECKGNLVENGLLVNGSEKNLDIQMTPYHKEK